MTLSPNDSKTVPNFKIRRIDFYAADWLAGTIGLSSHEIAAYAQICMLIYDHGGPIRDDDLWLAKICGMHWRSFRAARASLLERGKIISEDGHLSVRRCSAELSRARARCRSEAPQKGLKMPSEAPQDRSKSADINDFQKPQQSSVISKKERVPPLDSPPGGNRTRKEPAFERRQALADWEPSEGHRVLAYAEGRDDAWVERQADRYRDHQANAKHKHRDFEAGFRNWLRNAPGYEPKRAFDPKYSPVDTLYRGTVRAVFARDARRRNSQPAAVPLLDGRRQRNGSAVPD